MPRLSIIIPVLEDPKLLDDTLVSVLENRPTNCEILVLLNQPYDDPYELAGEVRFFEVNPKAGLVECLNVGLSMSRSPVIHVVQCGVEVLPGWADAAMPHFRNPDVAAVAAVLLDRNDDRKVVSAGLAYRAEGDACRMGRDCQLENLRTLENEICGPDLLAAFYCKSTLQEIGGFSSWTSDAYMGTDSALAIRQAGFQCILESDCLAKVDAASIDERPSFRLGCESELFFWRWASAHGWVRSMVGHAALIAGQCVLGLWHPRMLAHLTGRVWGIGRCLIGSGATQKATRCDEDMPAIITPSQFAATDDPDSGKDCESARAA